MGCEEFIRRLDQLMDDELDERQLEDMRAHAAECPDCARELDATLRLKAMLKSLPVEADVPLAAQAGWRKAVRAEAKRKRTRSFTRIAAAAAAVVVAVVGVTLVKPPAKLNATSAKTADSAPEEAYEEAREEAAPMAVSLYEAEDIAFEDADAGVVLAGGAATFEGEKAFDGEASLEADGAAEEAAAVSQTHSVTVRVEDVEAAGRGILDTALEYDGEAALSESEDGALVEATLPAADARELLEAVRQWDEAPDEVRLPSLADDGSVTLLIHISGN